MRPKERKQRRRRKDLTSFYPWHWMKAWAKSKERAPTPKTNPKTINDQKGMNGNGRVGSRARVTQDMGTGAVIQFVVWSYVFVLSVLYEIWIFCRFSFGGGELPCEKHTICDSFCEIGCSVPKRLLHS